MLTYNQCWNVSCCSDECATGISISGGSNDGDGGRRAIGSGTDGGVGHRFSSGGFGWAPVSWNDSRLHPTATTQAARSRSRTVNSRTESIATYNSNNKAVILGEKWDVFKICRAGTWWCHITQTNILRISVIRISTHLNHILATVACFHWKVGLADSIFRLRSGRYDILTEWPNIVKNLWTYWWYFFCTVNYKEEHGTTLIILFIKVTFPMLLLPRWFVGKTSKSELKIYTWNLALYKN